VAIIGQLNTRGGVQSCIFSLIRGLNQQGIIPDIVWDAVPNSRLLEQENLQVGYCPLRFVVSSLWLEHKPDTVGYTLRLLNTIRGGRLRTEYDFFYIFYNGFLLPASVPHVRYLSGPPLLPQLVRISPGLRGMPYRFARWLYRIFLHRFFPIYNYHADNRYVINSQYTADLFEEAHQVRLPVVYPPIDLSSRSFQDDDLPQRDTITFFSRIADAKRPERVIELAAQHKHLRCVIMGSVPQHRQLYFQHLQDLAQELGRPDIIFLATPSNERVRQELARTRFYVFPAHDEHFGMTTPEAIGSGAIPFVHDSGGQREIVPDERLRFNDENFFSRFASLLVLPDPELAAIRRRLRLHVDQYTENAFIERMLGMLEITQQTGTRQGLAVPVTASGESLR
jgi:glycosyltransferase involved in cell wall biosynthesis